MSDVITKLNDTKPFDVKDGIVDVEVTVNTDAVWIGDPSLVMFNEHWNSIPLPDDCIFRHRDRPFGLCKRTGYDDACYPADCNESYECSSYTMGIIDYDMCNPLKCTEENGMLVKLSNGKHLLHLDYSYGVMNFYVDGILIETIYTDQLPEDEED